MKKYKLNVTGSVYDTDTNFRCGFDITVENGGSAENIGKAVQSAIDTMAKEAQVEIETVKAPEE